MDVHEVVMKLIGPAKPIGETNEDDRRFENLKVLTELTDRLVFVIDGIARQNKDRTEYSMKRAGKWCTDFLADMAEAVAEVPE